MNPVLDEICIRGSRSVLTNIVHDGNILMSEIDEINTIIREEVGEEAKYIFGLVEDPGIGEEIMVTVIATGFAKKAVAEIETSLYDLDDNFNSGTRTLTHPSATIMKGKITSIPTAEELANLDEPSFKRREVKLTEDLSEPRKRVVASADDELDIDSFSVDIEYTKPAFLRKQAD